MELIRVENLCKTYHLGEVDVPVLRGVTFSIERGEMVALMGASGSGKTTLMNLLGCLDRPSSGEYWLDGQRMSQLTPDERAVVRTAKLGFVFQSFNLLPRTTALANVLMPLDYSPSRISPYDAQDRACELLDRVGLTDRLEHEPSQMSGGQQQRVAIARSLINNPALLLADEPTGNLDSHTSVEILEMFQRLNTLGITVILVTHDPKVALFAHRTIRIADGLIEGDEARVGSGDSATWVPRASHSIGHPPGTNQDGVGVASRARPAAAVASGSDPSPSARSATAQAHGSAALPATPAYAASAVLVEHAPVASAAATQRKWNAEEHRRPLGISAWMPATWRTALLALRRNTMRSALTSLGIIIGVTAVIAMVEIGQGSRSSVQEKIASMGANNLLIQSGAASSGGVSFGSGSVMTLTPQDSEQIEEQCMNVSAVSPVVRIRAQVVVPLTNKNWVPMQIYGTTPGYLKVRDWTDLADGEPFTDRDVLNANRVCLIGETLQRELFQGASPVGKDIRVRNIALRVVGVLSRKGANMVGMDQDDIVLAPWTTVKYRIAGTSSTTSNQSADSTSSSGSATSDAVNTLNNLYPGSTALYPAASSTQQADTPQPVRFANVDQILVKASSTEQIPDAMDEISRLLREQHRLRSNEPDDFNIRDMTETAQAMTSISQTIGILLLIVALISLVVGGVGIMNIMMVSVTERTREIGLRMAVGARAHHILRQFLIEAVVLCLFGGALGIVFGRCATIMVHYFTGWVTKASMPAILAAFLVSATIGVVFGFYPAWKASRLDPIEALRYE